MSFIFLPSCKKVLMTFFFKEISPRISSIEWSYQYALCEYVCVYIHNICTLDHVLRLLLCVSNGFGTFCVQRTHTRIWVLTLYGANFYSGLSFCLFQNVGPCPSAFVLTPMLPQAKSKLSRFQQSETKGISQSALQD